MGDLYPLFVMSPVIATALNVVVHIAINHLRRGRNPLVNLAIAFVIGAVGLAAMSLAILPGNTETLLEAIIWFLFTCGTYTCLGFCYFTFINLNLASLRVRIMKEIKHSPTQSLSLEAILEEYDSRAIVDARLERLTESGHFVLRGDRFFAGPNPLFRRLALVMDWLKWAILGRRIEEIREKGAAS